MVSRTKRATTMEATHKARKPKSRNLSLLGESRIYRTIITTTVMHINRDDRNVRDHTNTHRNCSYLISYHKARRVICLYHGGL